jgi:hypothetical protein
VVERAGFENRSGRKVTGGSNPSPSAPGSRRLSRPVRAALDPGGAPCYTLSVFMTLTDAGPPFRGPTVRIPAAWVLAVAAVPGLLAGCGGTASNVSFGNDGTPRPELARPLDHRPTERDLARLRSVIGSPKFRVIALMGHPKAVSFRDGREVWDYPWTAACRVIFEGDRAVDVYYETGT